MLRDRLALAADAAVGPDLTGPCDPDGPLRAVLATPTVALVGVGVATVGVTVAGGGVAVGVTLGVKGDEEEPAPPPSAGLLLRGGGDVRTLLDRRTDALGR